MDNASVVLNNLKYAVSSMQQVLELIRVEVGSIEEMRERGMSDEKLATLAVDGSMGRVWEALGVMNEEGVTGELMSIPYMQMMDRTNQSITVALAHVCLTLERIASATMEDRDMLDRMLTDMEKHEQ